MKTLHLARSTAIGAFAFGFPIVMLAAQEDTAESSADSQADRRLEQLVGNYQIIEGAKDGTAIPPERLKNNIVAITRDTIAVVDPDRKELYSARYKLGPANDQDVAQINMRSESPKEGANAVGLLKRDGEQVWLIYALDGQRPKDFKKTIEGQHLFKMKRKPEKPDGDEPADR